MAGHDKLHGEEHVDGTDDIRDATNALKGLATATQITALEAAVSADANLTDDFALRGNGGALGAQTSPVKITDAGLIQVPDDQGLAATTADASDNHAVTVSGGGAPITTRGGFISVHGNEDNGIGAIVLRGGVPSGYIQCYTNGVVRLNIAADGTITAYGVTTLADGSKLATSAAPTADAEIANMKYVVDYVAAHAGAVPFGAWTNLDSDTDALVEDAVYQVTSDGFVAILGANSIGTLYAYTDGSNPPTTLRLAHYDNYNVRGSFTLPIRNGDYWKVSGPGTPLLYWLPIGSGECEVQV